MSRPISKTLAKRLERYKDRFDDAYVEQDDWDGIGTWSVWIELKPGWHNHRLDPFAALHTIHEPANREGQKEAVAQVRDARRCDCEECKRETN